MTSLLLTARGVAERTGFSTAKVYRLIRERKIDSVHIEGSVRVSEDALERFIREHTLASIDGAGRTRREAAAKRTGGRRKAAS